MRTPRSPVRLLTAIALTLLASFMLVGCLESVKDDSAALAGQVNALNAQLQAVVGEKTTLEAALAAAKSNGTDPQAVAAMEAKLKSITDKVTAVNTQIQAGVAQLNDINTQIQAAKDNADATRIAIQSGTHIAAPFAGPYAPFVELGGALLAATVAGIMGRKSGVQSGVTRTAGPVEAGRNDKLEADLKASTGKDYLVVDAEAAEIGHKANGVAGMIQTATT